MRCSFKQLILFDSKERTLNTSAEPYGTVA